MAQNDFKPFAVAPNANVTPQADWENLPALQSGFTTGKASSAQVNKAVRQSTFVASAIAQFISEKTNSDVLDNGDVDLFVEKLSSSLSGSLIAVKTITTTQTYHASEGTRFVIVELLGGGGGGGGSAVTTAAQQSVGGGGGAGGYIKARVNDGFDGAVVTIGAGGSGVNGGTGTSGGTTSFGNVLIAPGGAGGTVVPNATIPAAGGDGTGGLPTGSNPIVLAKGSSGGYGIMYSTAFATSGAGAASFLYPGGSGGGTQNPRDGYSATEYGCGGGAGNSRASGTSRAGGDGYQGIAIIWEFS
ncbi:glycine-rich domain-containing protein [Citrobacter koseri]|uniref:glycine-rich domain-containing protein n=1 Tax=Citrobacter koseri TaxID=545 RepID=UPI000D929008|nr:hypothetical protein [Citrobacter koseri]EKX8767625.1 hypothetical protein [Citrobacter koseri]MBJ9646910.1 hypothetical protein [Citrobacter koseri]SQB09577.1 Uncharacterised protein [Citrobacter koseri]STB48148.1 Uncharacterised protein [Citrobacter koseri]